MQLYTAEMANCSVFIWLFLPPDTVRRKILTQRLKLLNNSGIRIGLNVILC